MSWEAILAIYLTGLTSTLCFNLAIIVGPVQSMFAVARNAILWPICLPVLIWLIATEGR